MQTRWILCLLPWFCLTMAVWSRSPIHDAVTAGDVAQVRALLKDDAKLVNTRYPNTDFTPLYLATTAEMAVTLLDAGAEVDARGRGNQTPLFFVTRAGRTEVMTVLLAHKAEVNARMDDQSTPLFMVAGVKQLAAVKLLLQAGAKAQLCDIDGNTALHRAVMATDNAELTTTLLAAGCNADQRAFNGATPLRLAIANRREEVCKVLLAHLTSEQCNKRFDDGNLPLHVAITAVSLPIVELLLANGADPNRANLRGLTPLHQASSQGQVSLTKALLAKGADVNYLTYAGQTPLMLALSPEIVGVLLDAGAKIDAVDYSGKTALHHAITFGHAGAAKALLDKGAARAIADNEGNTPLTLAQRNRRQELITLLQPPNAQ